MKVKYDKFNDLFWLDGKEVFWSSVYVLRQKEATLKSLLRKLKVSKGEREVFGEELAGLRSLGLITGKNKIRTTKKGKEFLGEIEKRMRFKNLRERGVEDIDDVFEESNRVLRLNPEKSRLLVRHRWHPETVEWFSLFFNSMIGFFVFFMLVLLFFFGVGRLNSEALVIQSVFAPIGSVMVIGLITIALWVFYHGGSAVGYFLFRHK